MPEALWAVLVSSGERCARFKRPAAIVAAGVFGLCGCSATDDSFQWREVSIAGRAQCLPVAFTGAAKQRGLQGVKHVVRPMVFAYSPPATPSFWMEDTPTALTGVWVGASGRVIGYWHGQPESTVLHPAPAPVSAVIEYRAGLAVPPAGSRVTLGAPCATRDQSL
jgi:uncharacterized membrane protein (UPF0127 family)